jgi:hypothetical protein
LLVEQLVQLRHFMSKADDMCRLPFLVEPANGRTGHPFVASGFYTNPEVDGFVGAALFFEYLERL